jgi:LysM repeat protein
MAEIDLHNAFEDCIVRLNSGQSIEECLRRYPQHASALRPMLEAGRLVYRAGYTANETAQAQARVRARIAQAARAAQPRPSPYLHLATLAAALALVFLIVVGGGVVASQSSLPGDWLYGIKRTVENACMTFAPDSATVRQELYQRRIAEIRQLITLGRAEAVDFEGVVQAQNGANWVIEGLPVTVSIPNSARAGDRVHVDARTTQIGQIVALSLILVEPAQSPLVNGTPVPTIVPATRVTPATNTPVPTSTPTATATATQTPTTTPSPTAEPTEEATIEAPSPTRCIPTPPSEWKRYTIQPGDTLSALAAARGVFLPQVIAANCLTDGGLIVAGQSIYLPVLNVPTVTMMPTASSSSSGENSSGSGSQPSGGGSNPTDDHGNDGSGHDSGDDHGGGSDSSGHG